MDDIFAGLPSPGRKAVKRTYSRRGEYLGDSLASTGLATPPASSSPQPSPVALSRFVKIGAHQSSPLRVLGDRSDTQSNKIPQLQKAKSLPLIRKRKQSEMATSSDKKPLVQMQLNLLPARVTCSACGMSYTRTVEADMQLHSVFHKAALHGIALPASLSNLSYPSAVGKQVANVKGAMLHMIAYRSAKPGARVFVKRVCQMVDVELSSTLPPLEQTAFTAFLCCLAGRCIGFLLVQQVSEAMPMTSEHELDLLRKRQAVLGVNRMWTVKSYRGKGVMRALLDYAREKLVYGCPVKIGEVAFTQLSGSGERFARAYTSTDEPLIYRD